MSENAIARRGFDYNALDRTQRSSLKAHAVAIKAAIARTQNDILEIGRRLKNVREMLNDTEFGAGEHVSFSAWIDGEFGMSRSAAYQFISVANAFESCPKFGQLSFQQSAIYALAKPSVPDEVRQVAVELAESGMTITHADAKALIEAGKDPVASQNGKHESAGPASEEQPSEPETEAAPSPWDGISEPLEDSSAPAPSEATSEAETDVPVSETESEETLQDRVKNAEVVHDTLTSSQQPSPTKKNGCPEVPEDEWPDSHWLQTIPVYRVLSRLPHAGLIAKTDILAVRELIQTKAQSTYEHHARRSLNFKGIQTTPAGRIIVEAATLPHPREWGICPPCRGNGCTRCGHAGYDLRSGISPERIERGEVEL